MAYGLRDVPQCTEQTYMGWRPKTEKTGRQICETHWNAHKAGRFSLYDAFGFKRPQARIKTVKLTEHCADGKEIQPIHRNNCAVNPDNTLLRECPGCGRENLKHRRRLCDDCRSKRRQKTNRENQRQYYRKQNVSA